MKRSVSVFCIAAIMCCMVLNVSYAGGDNFGIQERFSKNPNVAVIFTNGKIKKFPDLTPGGPMAKWSTSVPADFDSIASNEIVNGLKAEWPNATIAYEASAANKKNYDLVVYVDVSGTYLEQMSNLTLKMRTVLTILDPQINKNLTSFMGASLGEVSSPSAKVNRDSVFTQVIPPVSVKAALEQKTVQGLKDFAKEIKEAKK
jgi:hypothetical protein